MGEKTKGNVTYIIQILLQITNLATKLKLKKKILPFRVFSLPNASKPPHLKYYSNQRVEGSKYSDFVH